MAAMFLFFTVYVYVYVQCSVWSKFCSLHSVGDHLFFQWLLLFICILFYFFTLFCSVASRLKSLCISFYKIYKYFFYFLTGLDAQLYLSKNICRPLEKKRTFFWKFSCLDSFLIPFRMMCVCVGDFLDDDDCFIELLKKFFLLLLWHFHVIVVFCC